VVLELELFKNLSLHHWRQFNHVSLEFDSRMTVLTGGNGTGKTTVLNILSRHFGWNLQFVSTPLKASKRQAKQIWADYWDVLRNELEPAPGSVQVGSITYSNDQESRLMTPVVSENAQYALSYSHQETISGLHIPSHRPTFTYHRIANIPIDPKTSQQHYQAYDQVMQQAYQATRSDNPGVTLKQSLIALALFGYGSEAVVANIEYKELFERFQDILRILLPKNIGFRRLEVRMPEIVFVTNTGDFSLDAASGGIGAILGIAWQIFMYGVDKNSFVVTIDEPESHLHPSMQRELLPNLFHAFPDTQFIIATHSPFIVTSTPKARVYALVVNATNSIDSHGLETADLSGTANETLREILGVPISVPIWVEDRLDSIIAKYRNIDLSFEVLTKLKQELVANGLSSLLPDAIDSLGGKSA
jgi:predicted ATPase